MKHIADGYYYENGSLLKETNGELQCVATNLNSEEHARNMIVEMKCPTTNRTLTTAELKDLLDILESANAALVSANDCDYPSKSTENLISRINDYENLIKGIMK